MRYGIQNSMLGAILIMKHLQKVRGFFLHFPYLYIRVYPTKCNIFKVSKMLCLFTLSTRTGGKIMVLDHTVYTLFENSNAIRYLQPL